MLTFCVSISLGSVEVQGARFSERNARAAKRWVADRNGHLVRSGHYVVLTQMVDDRSSRGLRRWGGAREGLAGLRWKDTTPPTWLPRGTCPECRGVFALTARGTLRVHRRADGRTETTAAGVEIPAACCGVGQTPTDCQTGEPARV